MTFLQVFKLLCLLRKASFTDRTKPRGDTRKAYKLTVQKGQNANALSPAPLKNNPIVLYSLRG